MGSEMCIRDRNSSSSSHLHLVASHLHLVVVMASRGQITISGMRWERENTMEEGKFLCAIKVMCAGPLIPDKASSVPAKQVSHAHAHSRITLARHTHIKAYALACLCGCEYAVILVEAIGKRFFQRLRSLSLYTYMSHTVFAVMAINTMCVFFAPAA